MSLVCWTPTPPPSPQPSPQPLRRRTFCINDNGLHGTEGEEVGQIRRTQEVRWWPC